jgi:hypothetical protein
MSMLLQMNLDRRRSLGHCRQEIGDRTGIRPEAYLGISATFLNQDFSRKDRSVARDGLSSRSTPDKIQGASDCGVRSDIAQDRPL